MSNVKCAVAAPENGYWAPGITAEREQDDTVGFAGYRNPASAFS
jgi:hypothetical protein